MQIDFNYAQKLTSPNPFALISARMPNGQTNLMAISWWTYTSNHPPSIAICLSKKSYTNELIKNNQEFGLNIVDEELAESAFLCGTCSGRNEDKPAKFDISLVEPLEIETMLVKEHKVAFECRVVEIIEVNDHDLFIAQVVASRGNPEKRHLYALDGYRFLGTVNKFQPE